MQRYRGLALALYLVGATLIVIPVMDAALSVSPPHPGDFRWRFGAAGLLANALMIPNLGLLLCLVTALGFGHNAMRRVIGVLAFLGVTLCLAAMAMFALDAIQTRPAVRPEMNTSFAVASITALFKMLIGGTTLAVLGVIGLRKAPATSAGKSPSLLVIDQATQASR